MRRRSVHRNGCAKVERTAEHGTSASGGEDANWRGKEVASGDSGVMMVTPSASPCGHRYWGLLRGSPVGRGFTSALNPSRQVSTVGALEDASGSGSRHHDKPQAAMFLHDWKKFAKFASVLGISSFLHLKNW